MARSGSEEVVTTNGVRSRMRQFGLGRLAYQAWHAPVGAIRRSLAEGGPIEQWRTTRGRRQMIAAAAALPPLSFPQSVSPVEVHLLTGRRFWDQTAFCLQSFSQTSQRPVAPVIYDDGSLSEEIQQHFFRLFPSTRIVALRETLLRLDEHLPASRFPRLRDRWRWYPNIRKLLDVHVGSTGWKLVLDSDLLFFRRPTFLLDWLADPHAPLHAVDSETSYGYSAQLMNRTAGQPVAEKVNVGLTGLASETLDWECLERWCDTLISSAGTHYYLEQALVAMWVAGRQCAIAPADDYVTLPQPPEVERCQAVMHHYVAHSKPWYFRTNWRRFAASR